MLGRAHLVRDDATPPSLPLPAALQTFLFWREPLSFLDLCHARYGDRFIVDPVGTPTLVFLSAPADIKAVIAAPADALHPGAGAAVIEPLVGEESFMLQEEDQHARGRKAILPAFHHDAINAHTELVTNVVTREVEAWPLDIVFPIHPYLCSLTLKVVLMTIFGEWDNLLQTLHTRLFAMQRATPTLALHEPELRHLPGWRGTWKRFIRRRAEAEKLIFAVIEARCGSGRGSNDVLTLLLASRNSDGSPLSCKQLCDDVMTTIISGHETSASELAWMFQLLAHNPDVRRRLTDEIDDERSTKYLSATVHEVLRHRPVFLFAIPRAVRQPIEIGRWTYRPPVHLLACIYLAHHDPILYPEPHEFRPERFLEQPPNPHLWLPWGGGRKRCPGRHLATLEMRMVLHATLSKLDILPANRKIEHARWRSVIVTPYAGSRVILRKRNRPHVGR